MNVGRRAVIRAGIGAAVAASTAGCLGATGPEANGNAEQAGYSSFFTIQDWAENVAGDRFEFTNPVSTGEMGHGWSPDGNVALEIADTQVFLYLDTPEFSWAQDVASELDRDYEGVKTVDLLEGLGPHLLGFDSGVLPEFDRGHDYPREHLQLEEFDIYDLRSNEQLGYWHIDHWHGGVPDVPVDGTVPVGVVLRDDDGHVVPLGETERYRLGGRVASGEPTDVVDIEAHGRQLEFTGAATGRAKIVIEIYHGSELIYDTAAEPSSVDVVEEVSDGASEFHDPHIWVDPVLGQEMVGGIRDALVDLDPDNAAFYEENATEYVDRMQSVHETFETLTADADRDVAVLAGHDAFQYIERRYDFELHTPVGVSPDAAESFADVSGLIDVIDEHDIHTVLYDPFEAPDPQTDVPQTVAVLLENTDADNAEPLTPAEGSTQEWLDNGWGWIEQMTEINAESLRIALDA
ncbi:MAG: metal ABC transporter substrate-binding protein [Halorubrum sp.]